MLREQIVFFNVLLLCSLICRSQSTVCPFSDLCTCDNGPYVTCNVGSTFPKFTATNYTVKGFSITGNFTDIPSYAFSMFGAVTDCYINFWSSDYDCSELNHVINLTTYADTFATPNSPGAGFESLDFTCLNPVTLDQTSSLNYLYELTITYAGLTKVPTSTLAAFPQITNLDLSNNAITYIDMDDFNLKSDTELRIIWMSSNRLSTVDVQFSTWLNQSETNQLYLVSNPLVCNSSIQWMKDFVANNQIIMNNGDTVTNCTSGCPVTDYLGITASYCKSNGYAIQSVQELILWFVCILFLLQICINKFYH